MISKITIISKVSILLALSPFSYEQNYQHTHYQSYKSYLNHYVCHCYFQSYYFSINIITIIIITVAVVTKILR